ncbi:uncharacterized protein LOC112493647 [Cephus cinctus]|uniref:Uncharacterized protein LOC112493647 n=1 Tax=Cephus cinctus TaxID=211228 RepID=A0AAJ7R898_CEPCN|nr:uncharacterized protein LOC112493647 [Cephus cinctus]XP_024935746.1 uncharacterized protein LOC112493647 [Cephus cinctus]
MHLTRTALYSIRITLNQSNGSPVYRKSGVDRGTARSALLLATLGVSLSMFSLKQMLASSSHQSRLRRFQ